MNLTPQLVVCSILLAYPNNSLFAENIQALFWLKPFKTLTKNSPE